MHASDTTSFPVVFDGDGVLLAGQVHRSTGDLAERQPAVLVTGSWLTVKEQMADTYARALAARGYTAITFDFAHYGQSGSDLRHVEMPSRKITDIAAAARFAARLSFVVPDRVGYLAVCASAQYALAAMAGGAPIGSFVSVAGWYHDAASVAPFYGGSEGVELRLERARAALDAYLATGETVTVPAYAPGDDRAGMFLPMDYYGNPERGAVPAWTNAMAEMSWLHWLTFDGLSAAAAVTVPSLFVHSDGCVFPDNVKTVRDRITGSTQIIWSDGEQTDFYDRIPQVTAATDAADEHFRSTLA